MLWEEIDQFTPGTNFKARVFRLAYLQTLAHLKRQTRSQVVRFSSELSECLAVEAPSVLSDFEIRQAALRKQEMSAKEMLARLKLEARCVNWGRS